MKPQQERNHVQGVVEKAALEKQAQHLKSPRSVSLSNDMCSYAPPAVDW